MFFVLIGYIVVQHHATYGDRSVMCRFSFFFIFSLPDVYAVRFMPYDAGQYLVHVKFNGAP